MIYLGVEYGAKYTLEGPNGVKAVFNDSTDANYVGDLSPESSGLDAPEMREDSADRVEADGATFGDFLAGKRPVVLQGTIIATSKAQRNERVGKLRAASNAKTENAVLWWEDAAAGKVFVNLRRQQPLRVTKGYVKEFQLSMVSADSRILGYNLSSTEKSGMEEKSVLNKLPETISTNPNAPAWTNPNNAKAIDAVFATTGPYDASGIKALLFGTKFGFTVPTSAVLLAMTVGIKAKAYANEKYYFQGAIFSSLMSNGATAAEAANKRGEFMASVPGRPVTTTNTELEPIKGTANLPSAAALNLSTFGIEMIVNQGAIATGILSVDAMYLSVYYALGPEVTIENKGNVNAPTKFTITGPAKNPRILNEATGETFVYTGTVEAGRKLIIDTEAFTIVEEGTGITGKINVYNNVTPGSDWIQIKPGSNKLSLGAESGTAETKLKVEYRDAWE